MSALKALPEELFPRALIPHFKVGRREIKFPKFNISLIHSHSLGPHYARFQVPLSFNKLDLRDYLFHAYAVRTTTITSSITQGRALKNQKGQLKREPARKYMTARLMEPFVWPREPWEVAGVKREEWDGFQMSEKVTGERADRMRGTVGGEDKPARKGRDVLAAQARRLLEGRERWAGTAATLGRKASTPS